MERVDCMSHGGQAALAEPVNRDQPQFEGNDYGAERPRLARLLAGLDAGGRLEPPRRLAEHLDGPLEQLGLGPHRHRRLLERLGGVLHRLDLPSHGGAALLQEVEGRVERLQRAAEDLPLETTLRLEDLLEELRLPLERPEQLTRGVGAAAGGGRDRAGDGLHRRLPLCNRSRSDTRAMIAVGGHGGPREASAGSDPPDAMSGSRP